MKQSLKDRLVRELMIKADWVAKGFLTDSTDWFYFEKGIKKRYLAETVGRQLREAESESIIAVKDDGVSVQYKFIPPNLRKKYIPWSQRIDKTKLFRKDEKDA